MGYSTEYFWFDDMILDRFYQISALIIAFVFFRNFLSFLPVALFSFAIFILPIVLGLLIWNELNIRVGSAGMRALVRLRWELSWSSGILKAKRLRKISTALIKAYELEPKASLVEQAAQFERMMQDAIKIDRRVPPIFQKSLSTDLISKTLADAEGLSHSERAALRGALVKALPREQNRGFWVNARLAIRKALAPLAGSKVDRDRIGHVSIQMLIHGPATSNERLVTLAAVILDARIKEGFEGTFKLPDPIIDLPLRTQRKLVLLSHVAFGTADIWRIALTDPSYLIQLLLIKKRFDTLPKPEKQLWDMETAKNANTHVPQSAEEKSRSQHQPSKDELLTGVIENAKEAILLARTWPITGTVEGRSWFGGAPLLPSFMAWPTLPASRAPLHFLAQIDCAELPRVNGGDAMPEDGLLLFFAYVDEEMIWDEDDGSAQVKYVPAQDIPKNPAQLPAELADIFGKPGHQTYPNWPITPHLTESFCWNDRDPRGSHEIASAAQEKAISKFLPEPSQTKPTPLLEQSFARDAETGDVLTDSEGKPEKQLSLARDLRKAGFPFCGGTMNRFVLEYHAQLSHLIEEAQSRKRFIENKLETELKQDQVRTVQTLDAKITQFSKALSLLGRVSDRLTAFGDLEHVPDREAKFFEKWLEEMNLRKYPEVYSSLRNVLMSMTQEAVTDQKLRAVLPQALFDFFDAELRPNPARSQHMMLGHPQFRTNSTQGPGLRLLALDSDAGLDFMFCDAGMVEYWIQPEDLARRDFSQVVALTAGG